MEFLKKSIHMDQIGCEEQTQITLEDDVNIADAKPDVYQVVTQQGHVELEEVRASDGHVHVKGVLHFKVLYLADEETHHPACMEGELAFEEQILMGSVSGTDQVQAQAILEDLSVGMINSRKLSVQALLQIRLFTERMKQRSHDLLRLLANTSDRIARRIEAQKEELGKLKKVST